MYVAGHKAWTSLLLSSSVVNLLTGSPQQTHLGHEFHKSGEMRQDAIVKRAILISMSVKVH